MSKENKKNLTDIDREIQRLEIEKNIVIDESLSSNSADKIIKAASYLESKQKGNRGEIKAYLYSPEKEFYNGLGFKQSSKSITYDLLRGMGKVPIINSIINTRTEQVENFCNFTIDMQKEGWTIKKRRGRFSDKEEELTTADKSVIDKIATFLEDGGTYRKYDVNDDFDDFLRKYVKDSLELDQPAFEIERNRKGDLLGYTPIDGATIRLLEAIEETERGNSEYEHLNGYYPRYCQVYNNRILKHPTTREPIVYYPWELAVPMRNKSTDIRMNGYGRSELEILIETVTWILWGMQYNGNFFKQGSNPKGFFTLEDGASQDTLNEFRSAWRNMVSGVQNSHKTPVFEGSKVEWHDMQVSNKDMEFQNWNEFLILISCSVYRIDPSELGFSFQNQSNVFGQDGQKARLEHSKSKGLKPLLRNIEKNVNKYLVTEIDEKYEFCFTGIDLEDEEAVLEADAKKVDKGFVSMEDMFLKHSGRKFNAKKDTILNPVYWQAQQAKQFGGEGSNEEVDEMYPDSEGEGSKNPFGDYEKAMGENPIMQETNKFLDIIKNRGK